RSSSRGAELKTSDAIHGVEVGSSYHWMNELIPVCATSPTADLRLGGMLPYQGRVSSSRVTVCVASSPAMVRSQASSCSFVLVIGIRLCLSARAAGRACEYVVEPIPLRGLHRHARVYLPFQREPLEHL